MSNRIREIVLWSGAVLGTLGILWTVTMFVFGITPLVFTSGSMSPEIQAGDLAFSRTIDAAQIAKGDVVSVINSEGVRVTHRVVEIDRTDSGAVLSLKGDANTSADAEAYNVSEVERVDFAVPKLGYVVSWWGTPFAMFLGGMLAMAVMLIAFKSGSSRPPSSNEEPELQEPTPATGRRIKPTVMVAGVILSLAVTGSIVVPVQPTLAAFSDTGIMTTNTIAAADAPPKVTGPTCSPGSIGWFGNTPLKISWTALAAQNGHKVWYRVQLADNTAFTSNARFIEQVYTPSSTLEFSTTLSSHPNGTYYVRVQSGYEGETGTITWLAPAYRRWTISRSVTWGWGSLSCDSSTEIP